jgi:hypothetical protein
MYRIEDQVYRVQMRGLAQSPVHRIEDQDNLLHVVHMRVSGLSAVKSAENQVH